MATDVMFWDDWSAERQGSWAISNAYKYSQGDDAMEQKAISLQDLRRRSTKEIERLRKVTSFKVGDWKRTRLEKALGKRLATATLLDDGTHQEHTELMVRRFQKHWGALTKDEATERLRFLTILDRLVEVDADAMVDACDHLMVWIKHALNTELRHIGIIGCVEMEIVNLSHSEKKTMGSKKITHALRGSRATSSLSIPSLDENEHRKLNVLRAMRDHVAPNTLWSPTDNTKSWVLIHFHGVVHLGGTADEIDTLHERVAKKLRRHWNLPYAVELKKTFDKQQSRTKFAKIADYITKCGNERLRYETRFGRGMSQIDVTERAMWKQGYRGIDEVEGEESAMEDSVGLTLGEVEALGKAIDRLMKRNRRRDGYVLQIGRFNGLSRQYSR